MFNRTKYDGTPPEFLNTLRLMALGGGKTMLQETGAGIGELARLQLLPKNILAIFQYIRIKCIIFNRLAINDKIRFFTNEDYDNWWCRLHRF